MLSPLDILFKYELFHVSPLILRNITWGGFACGVAELENQAKPIGLPKECNLVTW